MCYNIRMLIVTVLICLVLGICLLCKQKSKGRKTPLLVFPSDYGLQAEEVSFLSSDGVELSGWFIAGAQTHKTIVFMHGFDMNKGNMLARTHFLAKDYNLFYMDSRGAGDSEGESGMGLQEVKDLEGALAFLREKKPEYAKEIAFYGLCMGAAVLSYYAATHGGVRCLVMESAYYSFKEIVRRWAWTHTFVPYFPVVWAFLAWTEKQTGLPLETFSLKTNASKIMCPVLMIHGSRDRLAPVKNARRILELLPSKKGLWIVPYAGHTSCHEKGTAYQDKIRTFFKENF